MSLHGYFRGFSDNRCEMKEDGMLWTLIAGRLVSVLLRSEIERQTGDAEREIWENSDRYGRNVGNWGQTLMPTGLNRRPERDYSTR